MVGPNEKAVKKLHIKIPKIHTGTAVVKNPIHENRVEKYEELLLSSEPKVPPHIFMAHCPKVTTEKVPIPHNSNRHRALTSRSQIYLVTLDKKRQKSYKTHRAQSGSPMPVPHNEVFLF